MGKFNNRASLHAMFVAFALFWNLPSQSAWAQQIGIYDSDSLYSIDPNGLMRNPNWLPHTSGSDFTKLCKFRVSLSELETRTPLISDTRCLTPSERSLVSINETNATLSLGLECASGGLLGNLRGHINWFPVTADGHLYWDSYAAGAGDHDLTIAFKTPRSNATTPATHAPDGQPAYHLEFYNLETLARLPVNERSWWHSLSGAMQIEKKQYANANQKRQWLSHDSTQSRASDQIHRVGIRDILGADLLDGRFATVTGLYNLDAIHDAEAELHPVYAMAILLDVDTSKIDHTVAERWAIMLRDRGNEGDCSSGIIPMRIPTNPSTSSPNFVFDLGWWSGVSHLDSVNIAGAWSTNPTSVPTVIVSQNSHVYINFPYPSPVKANSDYLFLGTIRVQWSNQGQTPYNQKRLKQFIDSSLVTKVATLETDTLRGNPFAAAAARERAKNDSDIV